MEPKFPLKVWSLSSHSRKNALKVPNNHILTWGKMGRIFFLGTILVKLFIRDTINWKFEICSTQLRKFLPSYFFLISGSVLLSLRPQNSQYFFFIEKRFYSSSLSAPIHFWRYCPTILFSFSPVFMVILYCFKSKLKMMNSNISDNGFKKWVWLNWSNCGLDRCYLFFLGR